MCVAFLAIGQNPDYPIIAASNRDEFYNRPTQDLHIWNDKQIIAGKDLQAGGTWFGIHKPTGRWSLITNYRDPAEFARKAKSRGHLVLDYLHSDLSATEYLQSISKYKNDFNGFNLIVGDQNGVYYYSNKLDKMERLEPGFHGLSNAYLNSSWPKVESGIKSIKSIVTSSPDDINKYYDLLHNPSTYDDKYLPDTGIGLEKEKLLSSLFIKTDIYGTRSSNVLLINKAGQIQMHERVWNDAKKTTKDTSFAFQAEASISI